jgi:hypothetical protein
MDQVLFDTLNNALVESALVNARALGRFFSSPGDVNFRMFNDAWQDDVIAIAAKIDSPISRHLNHATTGSPDGEPHPGEWPIVELAVILVGGLARFVESIDPQTPCYDIEWGHQSPLVTYENVTSLGLASTRTRISANPTVGQLTRRLHAYQHTRLAE